MSIRQSFIAALIACSVLVGGAWGAPAKPTPKPSPKPTATPTPPLTPVDTGARMLPNVTLRDRNGRKIPLSRYLGKRPIVLYLYNNPVDQTALDLQNLQGQMDTLGVQAIGIHGDRARRDRAQMQFQTVAIAYPVLLDDGSVARYYGATVDPTLVLVAPDGHEVKRWTSFTSVDKLSTELKDAVRSAVVAPPTEPPK